MKLHFDECGINGDVVSNYSTLCDKTFRIPDILAYIKSKIGLTLSTILQILIEFDRLDYVIINPQLFLDNAASVLKMNSV